MYTEDVDHMKTFLPLCRISLIVTGCVAAVLGGLAYDSAEGATLFVSFLVTATASSFLLSLGCHLLMQTMSCPTTTKVVFAIKAILVCIACLASVLVGLAFATGATPWITSFLVTLAICAGALALGFHWLIPA